jgi:aminopeptidase N
MAERAMKPATAGDLWHHISVAADRPVAAVAASWTDQPGLPLVEVDIACERDGSTVTLTQRRFALGDTLAGGPWRVPVRLQQGDRSEVVLLDDARAQVRWPGCSGAPLVANAGGVGYYRVAYAPSLRQRLLDGFGKLAPGDRQALVSDAYALAAAGTTPMAEHLALIGRVTEVDDASRSVMFALAAQQWRQLDAAFDGATAQAPVRAAGHAVFEPELARLGWDTRPNEDHETLRLRATVIDILAKLRHRPTLEAARQRFADALAKSPRIHPSVRAAILSAVGCEPSAEQFDQLLSAYRTTDSQEERWILHEALANGDDALRARMLLDEALSGRLPPDVSAAIPGAIGERPSLGPLAYAFVLDHWKELSRLAGNGVFGGQNWLLPGAAYWSSDPAMAMRLLQDQKRVTGDTGDSTAQIAAQGIAVRHRLREREAARLAP